MANEQVISLFSAQTTNASSAGVVWNGGEGEFSAWGTFGGGTCKLQYSRDGGTTWVDVDKSGDTFVTLTAAGGGIFRLGLCQIRANLAGATSPSLNATVAGTRVG